jgi:hypothetical protein
MRRIALAALLALSAPAVASAAPPAHYYDPSPYMSVKLGVFAPTSDDLDFLEFDSGLNLSVAFGRRFSPFVAAEFAVGWFGAETPTFSDQNGDLFRDRLSVVPLTGAFKLLLPAGPVEPYLEAGLGLYLSRYTTDYVGAGSFSDGAASLGLHLGAGAGFQLSSRTSLTIDLRFVGTRPEYDGFEVDVGGASLNGGFAFRF